MTKHRYPSHVVEAVAEALWETAPGSIVTEWARTSRSQREGSLRKADAALNALWSASRVNTLRELAELPEESIAIDSYDDPAEKFSEDSWVIPGDSGLYPCESVALLPARVIHWGSSRTGSEKNDKLLGDHYRD